MRKLIEKIAMFYTDDNNPKILHRIEQRLDHMVSSHNKVMLIRFDIHFPQTYLHNGKNDEISWLLKCMKEAYGPRLGHVHYVWARERVQSPNPHYHLALLVNGSLMQNPYGLLSDVGAIWNRILGGIYPGMIHFCGSQCLGDSTTGSVMIRRPSTVAEPALQAQQEQAYQAAYGHALYLASYLAKNFSKGGTPHRVQEFGCSQL